MSTQPPLRSPVFATGSQPDAARLASAFVTAGIPLSFEDIGKEQQQLFFVDEQVRRRHVIDAAYVIIDTLGVTLSDIADPDAAAAGGRS